MAAAALPNVHLIDLTQSSTSSSDSDFSASTPTITKAAFGDGIVCYGNERRVLQEQEHFYNNAYLSDITLKVGEDSYAAHKLILLRSSDVFERMLSKEWSDPDNQVIELVEESMCIEVFPNFLKFLYGCRVLLNAENALPVLVLADKYNVKELQEVCIEFARLHIIPKLQLKDVFHVWFQYGTKCYHEKLISSSVTALSESMDDITLSAEWEQEWINLEQEQLIEFLKSSNLTIKDEYELWQAVTKWLSAATHPERMVKMETHLKAILPNIRFGMMTPDQICDIEKIRLAEQYPLLFQPYLMQAFKFHSLSLRSRSAVKDFLCHAYMLRNYTELRWDKRLVIPNFSSCQKGSEISLRFTTRSSSFPSQTWEWELKVCPKGYSNTSEDFRCVLCSNLILDQPRPVEFLLSVVGKDKLLCSVSGKKNFSKNRYSADTEIDKKISISEMIPPDSPYLVGDSLIMQITLKPVE